MSDKTIKTRKTLFGPWVAWREPYPQRHGSGRTEEEAIRDFKGMEKIINSILTGEMPESYYK